MYLKPDSHSVSVENLKVAPTALLLGSLHNRHTHKKKINRKSNAHVAIFDLYQNVPVDQHNRSMEFIFIIITPVIFI